jgi:hypothetical protein
VNEYVMEEREDELLTIEITHASYRSLIEICSVDDFVPGFSEGLIRDFEILRRVKQLLAKSKQTQNWMNSFRRRHDYSKRCKSCRKLVVFSESKETTTYLVKKN